MALYDAQGSKLYVGDSGSPDASAQVLQVRRISDPQFSRPWKDRTDLDATNFRSGKPGLADIGEMSIEVFEDGDLASHAALRHAFMNNTLKAFRITWPDGNQMVFDGYVLGLGQTEEVDGDLVRTYTFRGTGAPSFSV